MRVVRACLIAWAAVVVSAATVASAQPEDEALDQEARALFMAGSVAFDAGRFAEALDYFEKAYELSQRPALLYNIGSAADRLRRDAVAIDAFERFLAAVPDAPERRSVEARIRVLRQSAGSASVAPPPPEEEAESWQVESEVAPMPTPEEAARESLPSEEPVLGDDASSPSDEASGGSKWWVWTLVGVVVVGAAVGLAVGLSGGDEVQDPLPGDAGVVVTALGAR